MKKLMWTEQQLIDSVKQRSIDPAMVQVPGVGSVCSVAWEHGNGVRPTLSDGV